jgi:hypothetical protein
MSEEVLPKIHRYSLGPNPELKDQIVYQFSNMTYEELMNTFNSALHSDTGLHSDLAGPLTDEIQKRELHR